MPLDIVQHFTDLGAVIKVHNAVIRAREEQKADLVAAVEQLDADYERVSTLPGFITNVVAGVNAINSAETNVASYFSTYHTDVLADEIESDATTASGVIDDLFQAMNDYAPPQTFLTSGNFHNYYVDKYGRTDVPNAASGVNTVDDSLAE